MRKYVCKKDKIFSKGENKIKNVPVHETSIWYHRRRKISFSEKEGGDTFSELIYNPLITELL
jgi:hypothetical protein